MRMRSALCACLLTVSICTGVAHAQSSTSSGVQGKFSGLVYDHTDGTFNSVLTLTNNGLAPVYSPLSVAINTGTSSVTVAGASSGELSIANIAGGSIQAGQSTQIVVQFLDPNRVSFVPVATSINATLPTTTVAVGPGGGPITASGALAPLGSVQINVPSGAFVDSETLTIGYSNALPAPLDPNAVAAGVVALSPVFDFQRSASSAMQQAVQVTVPYALKILGANDFPVVLYWDESLNRYQPTQIISVDQTNGFVTFATKHFSSFLVVGLQGLANMLNGLVPMANQLLDLDTGFRPQADGFEINNFTTGQSSIGTSGACYGLTSFAAWYFAAKPTATGLYNDPIFQTPSDPDLVHIPEEDAGSRELVAQTYVDTKSDNLTTSGIGNVAGFLGSTAPGGFANLVSTELILALALTHSPQMVSLYNFSGPFQTAKHSVLVYNWTALNSMIAGAGSFGIYDPNAPGLGTLALYWSYGVGVAPAGFLGYSVYSGLGFDAVTSHYADATLQQRYANLSAGLPPGGAWFFDNLSISSSSATVSDAYPGGPSGPELSVDPVNGTDLSFTWNDCSDCDSLNYSLHVIQNDDELTTVPIQPGETVSVTTAPFSGSGAELLAFVSSDPCPVAAQDDISCGYSAFQRIELESKPLFQVTYISYGLQAINDTATTEQIENTGIVCVPPAQFSSYFNWYVGPAPTAFSDNLPLACLGVINSPINGPQPGSASLMNPSPLNFSLNPSGPASERVQASLQVSPTQITITYDGSGTAADQSGASFQAGITITLDVLAPLQYTQTSNVSQTQGACNGRVDALGNLAPVGPSTTVGTLQPGTNITLIDGYQCHTGVGLSSQDVPASSTGPATWTLTLAPVP